MGKPKEIFQKGYWWVMINCQIRKVFKRFFLSLSKRLHRNLIQIMKIFSVLEIKIMTPLNTTKHSTLLFD